MKLRLGDAAIWGYFGVWEIYVIPLNLGAAYSFATVPKDQEAIPLFQRFVHVMSLDMWAAAVLGLTLGLCVSFAMRRLFLIRIVYGLLAAWWAMVTMFWVLEAHTAFFTIMFASTFNACFLRQATLKLANESPVE